MRANGTIDVAAVIRSMMKDPSELPMLLRTALDAVIGLVALLGCRQFLGPSFLLPAGARPSGEASTFGATATGCH
jgi:hypothetical protein